MIIPDLKSFRSLSKRGNLVAVTRTIPADLETPVSCFLKLCGDRPQAFLMESAEQEETLGRYSFIGFDPERILTAEKNGVTIRQGKRVVKRHDSMHLVDVMDQEITAAHLVNPPDIEGFCGGYVGYLSYENIRLFEDVSLQEREGLGIPEGVFFLCRDLVVFDHYRKRMILVSICDVSKGDVGRHYRHAVRKIDGWIRQLRLPLKLKKSSITGRLRVHSNMTRKAFEQKVRKIKEYIRAGDCIQVVLSQRFRLDMPSDDFRVYRALRSINPSPYMFYFRHGSLRLVGSSPEVLVRKMGLEAEVRPIAGTRPRGRNEAEDLRHENNLRASVKEMAEHLMLVDLGRNDLGRVCQYRSIKVRNFARVERYSHVMHLVSDVTGRLKTNRGAAPLLKAVFPAGTVSGAPKIRAMEIIDELETDERGPYAGCHGYLSFNGDMDMCITIRTLVVKDNVVYLQAGAGIVKDSSPRKEFQETVNKAMALVRAVEQQGDF